MEGVLDARKDGEGVFLEGAYDAFSGVAPVHVWWYELVSDLPVFLDDTLVFGDDIIIENLEVNLVVSQSEEVHNGVVGCLIYEHILA